jgi:hypothetical protein
MHHATRAFVALSALILCECLLGAQAQEVALNEAPAFAIQMPESPRAPQVFAIISCRADDLTGQPGRHGVDPVTGQYDSTSAAKNWRDLELHFNGGELECRRQLTPVYDQASTAYPASASPGDQPGQLYAPPLNHDFGKPDQCIRAALSYMATEQWDQYNQAWAVVSIGCPVPIVNSAGVIVGWHLPECPNKIGALEGIKCRFDDSAI